MNKESLTTEEFLDTLDTESLRILLYQKEETMRRKEILDKHPAPITQLPNGRWTTRLNGVQKTLVSREKLEEWIIEQYKEKRQTLNSLFPAFLATQKSAVSDRTWPKYITYRDQYLAKSKFGNKPITELNIDDCYAFFDYCMQINPKMKQRYWYNIRGFINKMFQYAIERRLIDRNPFRDVKVNCEQFHSSPDVPEEDTVFSLAEAIAIMEEAEKEAYVNSSAIPLGIVLLFNIAIRDGELCGLKWKDIELYKGKQVIHIQRQLVVNHNSEGKTAGYRIVEHTKSKAGNRRLTLNDSTKNLLKKVKQLNMANGYPVGQEDFIFQRTYQGKVQGCTQRCFDPLLRKFCRRIGLTTIKSPHDVRRTGLTSLYKQGMPLKKIQRFAGHSSLKQTMDYLRISDEDLDDEMYTESMYSQAPLDNIIDFRKVL